ncbi:SH3 domain-containing protein [Actinacidiphila bryophytorum]|uniref:SH3 domain-containing protein n=2 Tax=Actinacidiphila bryophytorum TaxID=1436133 RepID=A0A9W4E538_9ACTN|nr:SH3 domain-containing protein [Actinacidiphila bryophytorum]CAG7618292.1 SH3 domain-containing protein [Actinacidiphila bryophytorum]
MSTRPVPARRGMKRAVGALTGALAMGGALLAAAPAQAVTAAPALPYGTVTSPVGLNVRQFPSTDSSVVGFVGYNVQVGLTCKVRAQNIDGNTIWYLMRGASHERWLSARYVANTGTVPYCNTVLSAAMSAQLQGQHPNAKG